MTFLSHKELSILGLKEFGKNVLISSKASIYNPGHIVIGDNVRIDDFCILSPGPSAQFTLKSNIHLGCFSLLIGDSDIIFEDFSGISSYVGIYSSSDDYSGGGMTNPTIPLEFRRVRSRRVCIGRHAVIGTKSTVLPGCTLGEGSAITAHSLVIGKVDSFAIYSGSPAKFVKARKKDIILLEQRFIEGNY